MMIVRTRRKGHVQSRPSRTPPGHRGFSAQGWKRPRLAEPCRRKRRFGPAWRRRWQQLVLQYVPELKIAVSRRPEKHDLAAAEARHSSTSSDAINRPAKPSLRGRSWSIEMLMELCDGRCDGKSWVTYSGDPARGSERPGGLAEGVSEHRDGCLCVKGRRSQLRQQLREGRLMWRLYRD